MQTAPVTQRQAPAARHSYFVLTKGTADSNPQFQQRQSKETRLQFSILSYQPNLHFDPDPMSFDSHGSKPQPRVNPPLPLHPTKPQTSYLIPNTLCRVKRHFLSTRNHEHGSPAETKPDRTIFTQGKKWMTSF